MGVAGTIAADVAFSQNSPAEQHPASWKQATMPELVAMASEVSALDLAKGTEQSALLKESAVIEQHLAISACCCLHNAIESSVSLHPQTRLLSLQIADAEYQIYSSDLAMASLHPSVCCTTLRLR